MSTLDRLRELHALIKYHNNLYFVKEAPEISDASYDTMFQEYMLLTQLHPGLAQELAGDNNVLLPLGEESNLTMVAFKTPMMSLDKALNMEDLEKFLAKFPKSTVLDYEYKLDGLALEATYFYGVLQRLVTRYDGINGESVTHNVELFDHTLPLHVPLFNEIPEVHVRGEAHLTVAMFNKINEMGDKQYKTPRSAVSGLVRRLEDNFNSLFTGLMSFNVYYCDLDFGFPTYSKLKAHLLDCGFTSPRQASHKAVVLNERPDDIPTDGFVIKVDEIKLQRELGERQNNPRWAIAYKFPPETGVTEFLGVHWSLSMSGNLTPVAIYSPVVIGGVVNSNATLFNYRTFKQKELRLGAKLEISRSGDCVPHISNVLENGKGKLLSAPKECPVCGSILLFSGVSDEEVNLYCPNKQSCKGQVSGRINQFLGKTGLNVKGIGLVTVTDWVTKGIVKNLSDLYTVSAELLGERFHSLLHSNLNVKLSALLSGLGLPGVGVVTAREIATASIRENKPVLELLTKSASLIEIGVDMGVSLEVADYLSDPERYREAETLLTVLNIAPEDEMVLTGKRVYLTGVSDISRKEIKALLANNNIELSENFSGKIDVLLKGNRHSESKLKTALRRGIKVVELNSPFNLTGVTKEIDNVVE